MEEIVVRIEKWMSNRELTAPKLAEKLCMNRSTVVHIMARRNKPSLQFIINLAQFDTELDMRGLLTGTPLPSPNNNEIEEKKHQHPSITPLKELIVLNTDGTYKTFVEQQ